jgi:cyclophilin family peptidyl-prolyl cis-trans isomerase
MYPEKAPKTVSNFVELAKQGFFDGTKFHRVINDFMIQGGDPLSKEESQRPYWGTGGPGYSFEDEQNDLALVSGVIAMANSGPNTNGSQFFIITAEATPWLQGKHTGFGKVVSGLDIVEIIEKTKVGPTDQPLEDIEINSVEIL